MSFDQGELPTDLKNAVVTPIRKIEPRKLLSNHRPVSLTSNVVKILEMIVKKTIMTPVEVKSLLNNEQYGFRKGLSRTAYKNIHNSFSNNSLSYESR